MRFLLTVIPVLCLANGLLFSQAKEIDSLKNIRTTIKDRRESALMLAKIADLETGLQNDSALAHGQQIIAIGQELHDDVLLGKGYVITGSVKLFTGTPESCRGDLSVALEYGRKTSNNEIIGDVYQNTGNFFRITGQWDSAFYYFDKGYSSRKELNDPRRIAGSLSSLGAYNYHIGNLKKALEYYYEALPYREQARDVRGLSTLYTNIALVHIDRKEKTLALKANSRAMEYNILLGNEAKIASSENNFGIIYINELEYDSAVYWYSRSLSRRIGMQDTAGMSECYNNIGNVYNLKGDHEKALENYRQSLKLISSSDQWHLSATLCNFAVSASHCGLFDTAAIALWRAKEIVSEMGNVPDMRLSWHGAASDYYSVIGKFDSALVHYKLYASLGDSLYKSETGRQLNEMEAKYETTKKQKAIDELIAKQKQKDLQILAALAGIGLLIVLGAFVIYGSVQRKKTNLLLARQNKEISIKNKDITDSINYARRIQQSVLSDESILFNNVSDAFLHYKPRDIVSGDFYWFRKEGARLYVACADCTGHGVPGALVSVIGVNLLGQILNADPSVSTGSMLNQLHRMIIQTLNKDIHDRDSKDGMDIGVLCFDSAVNTVEFSGASRPLYHYNGKSLVQVKGDRYSIGGAKEFDDATSFTTYQIPLVNGHKFYLSTDGYADQFGGPNNKKFMSRQFFDLLAGIAHQSMADQQSALDSAFRTWKGNNEQVDDVLVIGVSIA